MLDRHRNPRYWRQPSPGRFEPTPALDAAPHVALGAHSINIDATVEGLALRIHRGIYGTEGRRYFTIGKGYLL